MSEATLPLQKNLYACHKAILKGCTDANKAFMACKAENEDPRACMELGMAVMKCTEGVLVSSNGKCPDALQAFAGCLDYNGFRLDKCREEQAAFDACLSGA